MILKKSAFLCVILTFFVVSILPTGQICAFENTLLNLPIPGRAVNLSPKVNPVLIKGLKIHPENPLLIDFIVDNTQNTLDKSHLEEEGQTLVKYFLASLTIPEKEQWVNLSPYEKEKILPSSLGTTAMGRDLLAEDYLLKQVTASLINPQKDLGKKFWDLVYQRTQEKFGHTNVSVDTFNKVWVVADKAKLFAKNNAVYIVDSHLKVMLDQDYRAISAQHPSVQNASTKVGDISSQVIREIVLPELEREINEGSNFVKLRQIYHSVILATWYKKNLTQSLLKQAYADKNKVHGIDIDEKSFKEKIYNRYVQAYKKGVFNFIREDYDGANQKQIPRKYFSGGLEIVPTSLEMVPESQTTSMLVKNKLTLLSIALDRNMPRRDKAMSTEVDTWVETAVPNNSKIAKKYVEMVKEREAEVRNFLKELGIDVFTSSDVKIFFHRKSHPFEIMIARKQIFIDTKFIEDLDSNTTVENFDRFTRALIQALVIDKKEGYKAQFLWVKNKLKKDKKLKELIDVEGILKEFLSVFIGNKSVEEVRAYLGNKHNVVRDTSETNIAHAIATEGTSLLKELLEENIYHLAVNFMNGEIEQYSKAKSSADDPTDIKGKDIRISTLAFAASPVTLAHLILASFGGMVISESVQSFLLITKGDFRKQGLAETFAKRFPMADKLFKSIFGPEGIVSVMPQFPDDDGKNGEEKIIRIVEINKEARTVTISYGFGGDHFKSIQQEFVRLTEDNKKDFLYYMNLPGYFDLLQRIESHAEKGHVRYNGNKGKIQALIEFLKTREGRNLLKGKLPAGGIEVPELDCVPKIWLINQYFKEKRAFYEARPTLREYFPIAKVQIVYTPRRGDLEDSEDPLRRELIEDGNIDVFVNIGINHIDISSTKIREGIVEYFKTNNIDLNLFAFLPLSLLKELFAPENRSYLEYLASMQGGVFPKSLKYLNPIVSAEEQVRRETILEEANRKLFLSEENRYEILLSDEVKGGRSSASVVLHGTDQEIASIEYEVHQKYDKKTNSQFISMIWENAQNDTGDDIMNTLKKALSELNKASDEAMITANDVKIDRVGGIDFNAANMDMDEIGDPINVQFSTPQIEFLTSPTFDGLTPRILDIVPLPSLGPVFGLKDRNSNTDVVAYQG